MNKLYGVSDKHTGPWLGESERPELALAKGRGMWGNDCPLYVAEIKPLSPSEGLPEMQIIIGDVREKLTDKYGIGADEVFDHKEVFGEIQQLYDSFKEDFDATIEMVEEVVFMVTSRVKIYSPNHDVKVGDFK